MVSKLKGAAIGATAVTESATVEKIFQLIQSNPALPRPPLTRGTEGIVCMGAVLIGIPLAVGALGFTPAGIAAGSIAAKMMSAAAIANGGGVAAGSTVAVLQSIGAAGLPLAAKIGLTTTLGPLGAAVGAMFSKGKKPPGDDSQNSSDDDDEDSDGMKGTGKPPETPATCPPS